MLCSSVYIKSIKNNSSGKSFKRTDFSISFLILWLLIFRYGILSLFFKPLVLRSILVLLKIESSGIRCEFREDVLKSILSTLRFHNFNGVKVDSSLHHFLSEQHLLFPEKDPTSQKPVSLLNVSNSPSILTIWEGMHYIKPWVHYLAPEIHKTVFWIWSLFILLLLWGRVMSLVTITIPHLASGSLTKAHRAGSNYKE